MLYKSTRDEKNLVSSADAILRGISKDGGLFVCDHFPKIDEKELESYVFLKYWEQAYLILKKFLTDFKDEDLKDAVKSAYFSNKFSCDDIIRVKNLNKNIAVLELWHGPTLAFKDLALQLLSHLLKKALDMQEKFKKVLILTATSGDTGKAALEGFKNVEGTEIFVFYPDSGVSNAQKLSMMTQIGSNVHVCGVDGNFDDAQNGIKKMMVDEELQQILSENNVVFSSANSINWGRLVAQIVYYFSAYCNMVKNGFLKFKEKINVVVPTGNFGNVLACYYAKKMGLFIEDIVVASNRNYILTDFINSGVYDKHREFYRTISPSMDILVSSNLERLIFDLYDDSNKVRELYENFSKTGKFKIDDLILKKLKGQFFGGFCDDEGTKKTISKIFSEFKYLCDPHTAVAFNVFEQYLKAKNNGFKNLVVSTASPLKFAEDVLSALGKEENSLWENIVEKVCEIGNFSYPKFFTDIVDGEVRFKNIVKKGCMKEFFLQELNIKNNRLRG